MIREDYLLGWIKRYLRWLAEITGFLRAADYEAAAQRADLVLRELLGLGADSVTALTDGELLARLAVGDPPPVVRDKCLLLAALLDHLGQVAAGRNDPLRARDCWLKALQVALGTALQGGGDLPEYAPAVGDLLTRIDAATLPPRTLAALVLYHEQRAAFAAAEDALFRLLDATADAPEALAIGRGFYQRLQVLSPETLAAGGLPPDEVAGGLAELGRRG
jgi:hypothetical protein